MSVFDKFSVRRAKLSDLELLVPLFDAYRVFYLQPSDPPRARTFLEARLKRDDSVLFVCETAEEMAIGFTQLYPIFSSTVAQKKWVLNDLFVVPEFRRKGAAGQLIDCAQEWAIESQSCGLALATAVTNVNAQKLYLAKGFEQDGFLHYSWKPKT